MGAPESPYQPPVADEPLDPGRNPVHTAVFGLLFLVLVVGMPLFVGGFVGLLAAPLLGGALWGLYRVTLPRGPKVASISERSGTTVCPACGSLQTEQRAYPEPGHPDFRCFACAHGWSLPRE